MANRPESRVILYCYGPECDMAERVGTFLAELGYKNLMIMSSGFPAWQKAKLPIDRRNETDAAIEDREEIFLEEESGDQVIAARRFCRCLLPFKVTWARSHSLTKRQAHDARSL